MGAKKRRGGLLQIWQISVTKCEKGECGNCIEYESIENEGQFKKKVIPQ
jgi:hypothetical protein